MARDTTKDVGWSVHPNIEPHSHDCRNVRPKGLSTFGYPSFGSTDPWYYCKTFHRSKLVPDAVGFRQKRPAECPPFGRRDSAAEYLDSREHLHRGLGAFEYSVLVHRRGVNCSRPLNRCHLENNYFYRYP